MKHESSTDTVHMSSWLSHQPRLVRVTATWLNDNRRTVVGVLGGLIVLGAIWGGMSYRTYYTQKTALELYSGLPVDEKGRDIGLAAIAEEFATTGSGVLANFSLGRKAYDSGDYASASKYYSALKSMPDRQAMIRILAQHNLATVLEAQGKVQEAYEVYRKAAGDPANRSVALTYYHMGRTAEALGKKDEALKWYEEATTRGLGSPVADRAKERMLWLSIRKSS